MTDKALTEFVPSGDGYEAPDTMQRRLARKLAMLPRVDGVTGQELPPDSADAPSVP